MSRRDDISILYIVPNKLDFAEVVLFVINIIASLMAVVIKKSDIVVAIAIAIQITTAFFYFILNVVNDGYFWYEAEKARRKNSIENGLGSRLSELETEEYYNNNKKESIEKYALNALESNMYSKEIAGKMILKSCVKSAIAIMILLIALRFVSNNEYLLIMAQTVFSSYILLDTVMLVLYKLRMDSIYKEGYAFLISPGVKGKNKNACLLTYAVEYEAVKAHYKIRLDEKIFKKNNEMLSRQWRQILSHIDN